MQLVLDWLRYDFTSIRLSKGLSPQAVGHARHTSDTGARDAPPRAKKSDDFGLADPNNSDGTKLQAFFVELKQGRSDQGSLPCSRQPRSPSRTTLSSRYMHRLQRLPGAGSSNRRADRRACRSS